MLRNYAIAFLRISKEQKMLHPYMFTVVKDGFTESGNSKRTQYT